MAHVVALSPITPHPSTLAAADAFLDHADLAATTRRVYRMSLPRWSTGSALPGPWPT